MSEMLYLQTERNIKITSPVVTLGDVAQLSCSDGAVPVSYTHMTLPTTSRV